ncbi:MAG TPA: VC0807 family protein [Acidimicrobiia bacterium]
MAGSEAAGRVDIVIPRPGRLVRNSLPQVVEASVVPAALFYLLLGRVGMAWALVACLTWSYGAIARRAVTGRRLPTILLFGAALTTLRTAAGLLSGSMFLYLVQPVLGTAVLAATFAVSVACGRPILVRLVRDFCPVSREVLAKDAVRSILSRLTLAWAGVHLLNGLLTALLLVFTPLGVFLLVKVAGTYLVTAAAVTASLLWGRSAGRAHGIHLSMEPRLTEAAPVLLLPAA